MSCFDFKLMALWKSLSLVYMLLIGKYICKEKSNPDKGVGRSGTRSKSTCGLPRATLALFRTTILKFHNDKGTGECKFIQVLPRSMGAVTRVACELYKRPAGLRG